MRYSLQPNDQDALHSFERKYRTVTKHLREAVKETETVLDIVQSPILHTSGAATEESSTTQSSPAKVVAHPVLDSTIRDRAGLRSSSLARDGSSDSNRQHHTASMLNPNVLRHAQPDLPIVDDGDSKHQQSGVHRKPTQLSNSLTVDGIDGGRSCSDGSRASELASDSNSMDDNGSSSGTDRHDSLCVLGRCLASHRRRRRLAATTDASVCYVNPSWRDASLSTATSLFPPAGNVGHALLSLDLRSLSNATSADEDSRASSQHSLINSQSEVNAAAWVARGHAKNPVVAVPDHSESWGGHQRAQQMHTEAIELHAQSTGKDAGTVQIPRWSAASPAGADREMHVTSRLKCVHRAGAADSEGYHEETSNVLEKIKHETVVHASPSTRILAAYGDDVVYNVLMTGTSMESWESAPSPHPSPPAPIQYPNRQSIRFADLGRGLSECLTNKKDCQSYEEKSSRGNENSIERATKGSTCITGVNEDEQFGLEPTAEVGTTVGDREMGTSSVRERHLSRPVVNNNDAAAAGTIRGESMIPLFRIEKAASEHFPASGGRIDPPTHALSTETVARKAAAYTTPARMPHSTTPPGQTFSTPGLFAEEECTAGDANGASKDSQACESQHQVEDESCGKNGSGTPAQKQHEAGRCYCSGSRGDACKVYALSTETRETVTGPPAQSAVTPIFPAPEENRLSASSLPVRNDRGLSVCVSHDSRKLDACVPGGWPPAERNIFIQPPRGVDVLDDKTGSKNSATQHGKNISQEGIVSSTLPRGHGGNTTPVGNDGGLNSPPCSQAGLAALDSRPLAVGCEQSIPTVASTPTNDPEVASSNFRSDGIRSTWPQSSLMIPCVGGRENTDRDSNDGGKLTVQQLSSAQKRIASVSHRAGAMPLSQPCASTQHGETRTGVSRSSGIAKVINLQCGTCTVFKNSQCSASTRFPTAMAGRRRRGDERRHRAADEIARPHLGKDEGSLRIKGSRRFSYNDSGSCDPARLQAPPASAKHRPRVSFNPVEQEIRKAPEKAFRTVEADALNADRGCGQPLNEPEILETPAYPSYGSLDANKRRVNDGGTLNPKQRGPEELGITAGGAPAGGSDGGGMDICAPETSPDLNKSTRNEEKGACSNDRCALVTAPKSHRKWQRFPLTPIPNGDSNRGYIYSAGMNPHPTSSLNNAKSGREKLTRTSGAVGSQGCCNESSYHGNNKNRGRPATADGRVNKCCQRITVGPVFVDQSTHRFCRDSELVTDACSSGTQTCGARSLAMLGKNQVSTRMWHSRAADATLNGNPLLNTWLVANPLLYSSGQIAENM